MGIWRGGFVLYLDCTGQHSQQGACFLLWMLLRQLFAVAAASPLGREWAERVVTGFWFSWGGAWECAFLLRSYKGPAGLMLLVPAPRFKNHWHEFLLTFKTSLLDVWLAAFRRPWAILIFVSKLPAVFPVYSSFKPLHHLASSAVFCPCWGGHVSESPALLGNVETLHFFDKRKALHIVMILRVAVCTV